MNKAFEKILERIKENSYMVVQNNNSSELGMTITGIEQAINEVAEEYNGGWIPCSERLPENVSTVVIQLKEIKKPTFGWYSNITGFKLTEEDLELKDFTVIAWQPLPEPYKERD